MLDILQDYRDALARLIRGKPENVPKGTKITNDSVSLEAGRKKGTIKRSRPIFKDLIDEINAAAAEQLKPEDAQKMIHVFMGDEDRPHILPAQMGLFQLTQESVPAAAIDEQILTAFMEDETSIITMGHRCVPRP